MGRREKKENAKEKNAPTHLRYPSHFHPPQLFGLPDQHMYRHIDELRIRPPVRQPEHLIPHLEPFLPSLPHLVPETLDHAGELNAERRWRLGGDGIHAFALQQIHPVKAEGADFHDGGVRGGGGFGDGGDVEGGGGAGGVGDGFEREGAGLDLRGCS